MERLSLVPCPFTLLLLEHVLDWHCQWCDCMNMRPQLLNLGTSRILKGQNACMEVQLPIQWQRGDLLTDTTGSLPGDDPPVLEWTSSSQSLSQYYLTLLEVNISQQAFITLSPQLCFRSLPRSLCCYLVTLHYKLILLSCLTQNRLPPQCKCAGCFLTSVICFTSDPY